MTNNIHLAQKYTKDSCFYGPIHASNNGYETYCGLDIDEKWYILTNQGNIKDVTCRKCRINDKGIDKGIGR